MIVVLQCWYPLCLAGGNAAADSSAASSLCFRILLASVPSSGVACSLNHGCWSACLAVIRSFGSYIKIFFNKSRKFLQNLVLSGMISCIVLVFGIG